MSGQSAHSPINTYQTLTLRTTLERLSALRDSKFCKHSTTKDRSNQRARIPGSGNRTAGSHNQSSTTATRTPIAREVHANKQIPVQTSLNPDPTHQARRYNKQIDPNERKKLKINQVEAGNGNKARERS